MNILFYDWHSFSAPLIIEALKKLGHSVSVYNSKLGIQEIDSKIMTDIVFQIHRENISCIFSVNYIQVLASICDSCEIPYISWTYDSPQFPLYSPTRNYKHNYQFLFDKEECYRLAQLGSTRIFYEPLASAPDAFSRVIPAKQAYLYDVSFIGSLYDKNSANIEDPFLKGFIDGIVHAHSELSGISLCEAILTDEITEKLMTATSTEIPEGYCIAEKQAISNYIERIISKYERHEYIKTISNLFDVHLFTNSPKIHSIKAHYHGYVKYETEMPLIFNQSKVNLHFAPRNIHSGISLRVFDVLASCGFLLTTWQESLLELFTIGKDLETYSCKEELIEKINYYLSHEKERENIAQHGFETIKATRTYEIVLADMLSKI